VPNKASGSPSKDQPRSGAGTVTHPFIISSEVTRMAYGKGGKKSPILGTKIGNHKRGPGLKLHSDMRESAAKGHSKAPKMARKSL